MTERKKFSDEQILEVGIRYQNGDTLWELAHFIMVASTGPVERILDELEISRRPRGRKRTELPGFENFQRLYSLGLTQPAQIAKNYRENGTDVDSELVRRRLKEKDGAITLGGKKIKS